MLRLFNNLQLLKLSTERDITQYAFIMPECQGTPCWKQCHLATLSSFSADFDHICFFDELLMVAIDTLLNILLGLIRVHHLPVYWLSIVVIEGLV